MGEHNSTSAPSTAPAAVDVTVHEHHGTSPRVTQTDPLELLLNLVAKRNKKVKVRTHGYWLTASDEEEWAGEFYGAESLRVRFVKWLNSHKVQTAIILLLIVDVLIVVAELFLDAEFPYCSIIERDAISCCNVSALAPDHRPETEEPHLLRLLSADDGHGSTDDGHGDHSHHELCSAGLVQAAYSPATCDPHKWAGAHTAHDILFYFSISILFVFEIELLLLVAILGFNFARNILYVCDLLVVTTSIVLELYLKGTSTADAAAILIFARSWRFVRIGHGLSSAQHETEHIHHQEIEHHVKELEREVRELRAQAKGPKASE